MNSEKKVREVKKMASNVNFSEEEFKRITEENKAHVSFFKIFIKKLLTKCKTIPCFWHVIF